MFLHVRLTQLSCRNKSVRDSLSYNAMITEQMSLRSRPTFPFGGQILWYGMVDEIRLMS
jgi:hypothetical protein